MWWHDPEVVRAVAIYSGVIAAVGLFVSTALAIMKHKYFWAGGAGMLMVGAVCMGLSIWSNVQIKISTEGVEAILQAVARDAMADFAESNLSIIESKFQAIKADFDQTQQEIAGKLDKQVEQVNELNKKIDNRIYASTASSLENIPESIDRGEVRVIELPGGSVKYSLPSIYGSSVGSGSHIFDQPWISLAQNVKEIEPSLFEEAYNRLSDYEKAAIEEYRSIFGFELD